MKITEMKRRWGAMRVYLIAILVLVSTFYIGYQAGHFRQDQQQRKIAGLEQSLANATDKNHQLVRQLNILGVELEVERLANQENQSQLHQALQQKTAIKEELSFYQRVMAPELQEQGVAIDDFSVQPSAIPGNYHFALVMMQQSQRNQFVEGKASVVLHGTQDGETVRFNLLDLDTSVNGPLSFHYRFFEVLEGNLSLPEGFTPERVEVHFAVTKPDQQNLHRTFSWSPDEKKDSASIDFDSRSNS